MRHQVSERGADPAFELSRELGYPQSQRSAASRIVLAVSTWSLVTKTASSPAQPVCTSVVAASPASRNHDETRDARRDERERNSQVDVVGSFAGSRIRSCWTILFEVDRLDQASAVPSILVDGTNGDPHGEEDEDHGSNGQGSTHDRSDSRQRREVPASVGVLGSGQTVPSRLGRGPPPRNEGGVDINRLVRRSAGSGVAGSQYSNLLNADFNAA